MIDEGQCLGGGLVKIAVKNARKRGDKSFIRQVNDWFGKRYKV